MVTELGVTISVPLLDTVIKLLAWGFAKIPASTSSVVEVTTPDAFVASLTVTVANPEPIPAT